jgi:hypothetical protein
MSDTMQRREKTIVNTLVDPMENERRENLVKEFRAFYLGKFYKS